jgi:hypothetical protein
MKGMTKARMTKDEGMTKSELAQGDSDEVFWNSDVASVVREELSDKRDSAEPRDESNRQPAGWRWNQRRGELRRSR